MELRHLSILVLVATSAASTLSAQRFKWDLEGDATAEYRRRVESHSRVIDPAPGRDVADAVGKSDGALRPASASAIGKNLIANPSFEKLNRNNPRGWTRVVFIGQAKQNIDKKLGRRGKNSAMIASDPGTDAAWYCNVKVKPGTWYRLSGWIKTKDVGRGAGAQLNINQFGRDVLTERVSGTADWTEVATEFRSGDHATLRVDCLFGGWHRTRGRAWFDDIKLVEIARKSTANPIEAALFPGPRRSTTLTGKDLDPTRQFLRKLPDDLRDLGHYLAMDLRRANRGVVLKKKSIDLPGFAPMWLDITYHSARTDGTQEVSARLRPRKRPARRQPKKPRKKPRKKPARKPAGKAAKKPARKPPKVVLPELVAGGTLVVTRFIENRHVARFETRLLLEVEIPTGFKSLPNTRRVAVDIKENWTWLRSGAPEDSVFQARVNEAIRNGARHLSGTGGKNLRQGKLALVVLTLLKAGRDARDPLMVVLLDRLRRSKMTRTYDCAVGIMALEALYAPLGERDLLLAGRINEPMKRTPTPADFATIQRWTTTLRGNIDQRVGSAYLQRWNYTPGKRFDNSNTQYAMLGLYTASLCGVKIPSTVWFASANHWLRTQSNPIGKPVVLDITSYQEAREREAKGRRRRTVTRGPTVRPRGWGYTGSRSISGSMTTAGITGLVICAAALRAGKKGNKKLFTEIRQAIRSGFAWLDRNFAVDKNPGGKQRWHYYYLYGLERACEINGTKLLNGRRWYVEGAELLLADQRKDGAWTDVVDTCFAILFLKKAAPPVITGGR